MRCSTLRRRCRDIVACRPRARAESSRDTSMSWRAGSIAVSTGSTANAAPVRSESGGSAPERPRAAAPRPPSHHALRFLATDAIDSLPPRRRLAWSSTASDTTTSHRCASAARTRALANAGSTTSCSSNSSREARDDSVPTPPASAHLDARLDTEPGARPCRIVPSRREIVRAPRPDSFSIPGASTDHAFAGEELNAHRNRQRSQPSTAPTVHANSRSPGRCLRRRVPKQRRIIEYR
jgi:hypothetical protein